MRIQVTIICNGEITSQEIHDFPSPWRAIADTVDGCGYIYHPKMVTKDGETYQVKLADGTIVKALKVAS